MENSGIYKIENIITGKIYIGSATNFNHRWRIHIKRLNKKIHHSKELQEDWLKFGIDAFKFEIIQKSDKKYNRLNEQCWINFYNSVSNGYNTYNSIKNLNLFLKRFIKNYGLSQINCN